MSTTPTRAPSAPTISPQRRLLVDQARQSWIRKLIDLSRRNNLLYFRPLKTGTLDLSNADQENMAAFLQGEEVSVRKLVPAETDDAISKLAREIARRAMANLEEKCRPCSSRWEKPRGLPPTAEADIALIRGS